LIQGRDDAYGTLAQLDAIEAAATVPVRRLVLEKCGHSPHRDQPDAVIGAVRDFLGF
jgi:pimeloyl-ACP methyl ester carboxylesterase